MSRRWAGYGPLMLFAVGGGVLFAVGGCATASGQSGDGSLPAYRPRSAPASAAARGEGVIAPDPATVKKVSLAQLLAYAAGHAPPIRIGVSRLTLGDAELEAASPLLPENPNVSLSLGPRLSGGGKALDIELSIQQRIQIGGERGLRIEAARRFRDRLHAELSQTRWAVRARVRAGYRVAQVRRYRLRAADRLLAFAERLLSIAQRREAAGAISGLQVQVVKGELAQARQAKIRADNGYRAARLRLAELSGWPIAHLPSPVDELAPSRTLPTLRRLLEQARTKHPALQALAASAQQARAQIKLADRELVPKPALGLSYVREGAAGGNAATILLGTLSVAIPLWQRNQAPRARARARLSVIRARYLALEGVLQSRVARAFAAVDAGARRMAVYGREVLPTFERNLKMIQRAFEAGKIDVLQVMVARGRFLEIQRQSLDAHEDYYRAIAALEAVVGAELWPRAKRSGGQR